MTKVDTLQRRNLILGGLAVALALLLVLRPSETSVVQTESLPRLVPDLKIADVRGLVLGHAPATDGNAPPVEQLKDEIRLDRQGDVNWVIASAGGYPASADKVTAFLEDLLAARRQGVVTTREDRFGDYAGPDGWTRVEVLGAGGKALATVDLGKTVRWNESFVRWQDEDQASIVRVLDLTPDKARLTLDAWTEARLWPGVTVVDVNRVDVVQRDEKRTLSFRQAEPEPDASSEEGAPPPAPTWKMVSPKEAEPESWRVENLVRAFTGMRFKDVVGSDPTDEQLAEYGLDAPGYRVVVFRKPAAEGQEPTKYVLEVGGPVPAAEGGKDPEAFYVRKGGDPWVYTVSNYGIGDFRKSPDDFLPPPPEPAAGDEGTPAPAGDGAGTTPPGEAEGSPDAGSPPEGPTDLPPLPGEGETPPPPPGGAGGVAPPEPPEEPKAPEAPGDDGDAGGSDAPKAPEEPKAPDAPPEETPGGD